MIHEIDKHEIFRLLKPDEEPVPLNSAVGRRVVRQARKDAIAQILRFCYARAIKGVRLKSNDNVRSLHESFYKMTVDEYLRSFDRQIHDSSYLRVDHAMAVHCDNTRQMVCNRTILGNIVAELCPATVCEVGSGAGATLYYLAGRFPGIRFTGYELAESGVELCRQLQKHGLFDTPYGRAYDLAPGSDELIRGIEFSCASAFDIGCGDSGYDLVYTFSALEQMAADLPKALAEIRRICRKYVVFHEPFPEVNDTCGNLYLRAGDYFRSTVADVERHGFKKVAFLDNLPMKSTFGYGILVAEVIK